MPQISSTNATIKSLWRCRTASGLCQVYPNHPADIALLAIVPRPCTIFAICIYAAVAVAVVWALHLALAELALSLCLALPRVLVRSGHNSQLGSGAWPGCGLYHPWLLSDQWAGQFKANRQQPAPLDIEIAYPWVAEYVVLSSE